MKYFFNLENFKLIPRLITITSGIIFFQFAALYENKLCNYEKPFVSGEGTYCKLLDKTKITFPSKYVWNNYKNLKRAFKNRTTSGTAADNMDIVKKRFGSFDKGFSFYYPKGSRDNAGFILLSRADPQKDGIPSIELWDLNNQSKIMDWEFNLEKILKDLNYKISPNNFVFSQPLLLKDRSLILLASVPYNGKLLKFSKESELIKANEEYIFHHSIEIDNQEKIYVPITMKNPYSQVFADQGFAILDTDLNVLKTYSLTKILKKAGLDHYIFSTKIEDPFHINDVTPLKNNKKTNVVLISIRSLSSVIAYDMELDKVVWKLHGYWNRQHDVDILDSKGTYISIFDNNVINGKTSNLNFFTTVENLPNLEDNLNKSLIIYNANSNHKEELSLRINKEKFNFLDNLIKPQTITAGQAEYILDNDSVFIEESNYGRSFEYDIKRKKLLWQYINRNDEKDIYFMKFWSRRFKELPFDAKIRNN
tara:strand:- start:300 stop:1736 length:1437 start_codon:yes stop_codon:yes gene_type:complete